MGNTISCCAITLAASMMQMVYQVRAEASTGVGNPWIPCGSRHCRPDQFCDKAIVKHGECRLCKDEVCRRGYVNFPEACKEHCPGVYEELPQSDRDAMRSVTTSDVARMSPTIGSKDFSQISAGSSMTIFGLFLGIFILAACAVVGTVIYCRRRKICNSAKKTDNISKGRRRYVQQVSTTETVPMNPVPCDVSGVQGFNDTEDITVNIEDPDEVVEEEAEEEETTAPSEAGEAEPRDLSIDLPFPTQETLVPELESRSAAHIYTTNIIPTNQDSDMAYTLGNSIERNLEN